MRPLKVEQAEKIRALQINPYFDHMDERVLLALAECVSLREFERGETLFFESDPCAGLHILHAGCVKLYRNSPQGRQYIVRLLQEKDTFNEVSVFDVCNNPVNAEAIEPSQVWVMEPNSLRQMVGINPDFAQKVINNLCANLRMLVKAVSEMAFFQVTHRLARLLASQPAGDLSSAGTPHLTQEQLAARLGTVREVVARSLRELERSGAIQTRNRRISIADPSLLEQWTQGPWG
jgi:CRP-like cAMP-binding protein